MDEKIETGADASTKLGSSSVLPADEGSKNLDDPSLENPVDVPLKVESSLREDPEPADWDEPMACQLEELLLSNMRTIFQNATKMIIDCGYEEAVARKAVLRCGGLYQRGKNLVSNVVNDVLASLKKGKGGDIPCDMFQDLQQLVEYAMVGMISVLRVVDPSLSVAEAMWRLLLLDLNIFMVCELQVYIFQCKQALEESYSQLRSESCSENYLPERLEFGSLVNLTNPNHPVAYEALTPEKDSLVPVGASRDYIPVASTSEGKPATGRKRRSEKALAAQKSFNMEECKVACPTCAPHLSVTHMKNASSNAKIITKAGGLADDESHHFLTISSPGPDVADNSSILSMNGTKYAIPTPGTGLALSSSSSSENKPVPKSVGRTSKSSKIPDHGAERKPAPEAEGIITSISSLSTNYFARIPYDKSLGIYIPQDEKDKWILKLVPKLQELQNELHNWTLWTNQKVEQAVLRIRKARDEIKSLRRKKKEAEQLKMMEKIMVEKRLSMTEYALNNTTNQVENADSRLHKLEVEHSALKNKMEIAKVQEATSASTYRKAIEIELKALKDVESRDAQRTLLQKELASEKQKAAELKMKIANAKKMYNETKVLWKQERMAMEKFLAQAASIRKETECLEAGAQKEEDEMKLKSEEDMQKYEDEVKKLKDKLSELKVRLGSSKIAGLWRGTDGFNGQCSSVNEGNEIPVFTKRVVDINDNSGSRRWNQERECVMCLSQEKIAVFLPCAHQVLCVNCNEIHQKKGMKYCPACRSPITHRVCVRFAEHFARL